MSLLEHAGEKRLQTKRNQSHVEASSNWFPYYAGFPPNFVRNIIDILDLPTGSVLLDPWNGTGTTTKVAAAAGYHAIGTDINPIANLVASARLCTSIHYDSIRLALDEVVSAGGDPSYCNNDDPLLRWLTPHATASLRRIQHNLSNAWRTSKTIDALFKTPAPAYSLLVVGLLTSARKLASPKKTTNPTWTIPNGQKDAKYIDLIENFSSSILDMLEDIKDVAGNSRGTATVLIGDVRRLPIISRSVRLVITSPPYCTRIDYVVNTSFELAVLGMGNESKAFKRLRRRTMGTPLTRMRELPSPKAQWPSGIKALLAEIQMHPSPDSHSYYYKNFWQYFDDLISSLLELRRVLEPEGLAIIVAQSSYYKEILIDLPDLIVESARSIGLSGYVTCEFPITRVMTSINARAAKHKGDREYRESIIAITAKNPQRRKVINGRANTEATKRTA